MENEMEKVFQKLDEIKTDIHHLFDCLIFIKHFAISKNKYTILAKVLELETILNELFDKYLQLRIVIKRLTQGQIFVERDEE